jgi:hypothetical protein
MGGQAFSLGEAAGLGFVVTGMKKFPKGNSSKGNFPKEKLRAPSLRFFSGARVGEQIAS